MRRKGQYKAIFEMHIDFKAEEKEALINRNQVPILGVGNEYYLPNEKWNHFSSEKKVSYEEIVRKTKTIINEELNEELKKYIECANLNIWSYVKI